jgi:hypothetical protein
VCLIGSMACIRPYNGIVYARGCSTKLLDLMNSCLIGPKLMGLLASMQRPYSLYWELDWLDDGHQTICSRRCFKWLVLT